jgi:hypothetical protein
MEEYGKFRDRRKSLTPDSFVLPTEAEKNRGARRIPLSKKPGAAWVKRGFDVGVVKLLSQLQLQLQNRGYSYHDSHNQSYSSETRPLFSAEGSRVFLPYWLN